MATAIWQSSRAALPLWKSGLLPWNPALRGRAERLAGDLDAAPLPDLAVALDAEIRRRAERLATGIERYRHHAFRRAVPDPPCCWARGTTELRDFGTGRGQPLLVVPSLVNRAYILDFAADHSMLRSFAAAGLRPFLLDWQAPGEEERGFDLSGYIHARLEPALDHILAATGQRPILVGYCMGGLLALAVALRRTASLAALVLLATPWDFSAMSDYAPLLGALADPLVMLCRPFGQVPSEIIHQLFAVADPLQAIVKYQRFAAVDPESDAARRFVAAEDWLNDSVPLALGVARECLAGWYGANSPVAGAWRIGGEAMLPERLALPTLIVQPARDRLVPPASVAPLIRQMPHAERLAPNLGHIGIAIAPEAPRDVWQRMVRWIEERAAASP